MMIADENGEVKEVYSSSEVMSILKCQRSTVRLYLRTGQIEGTLIFDEKKNREIRYIFADSVHKFQRRSAGRPKGSKDKNKDYLTRKKRGAINKENGRLGGLANKGKSRKPSKNR